MPDGAIVLPDTAVAPKDYTLSGAQEIALKSVRALIDGSGAATPFLPTLQLLDQNGHVCWEGAAASTVAAGGSADVSWFPVGAQLGGGTSTSTAMPWAKIDSPLAAITLNAGTTALADMDTTTFYTNNSGVFGTIGWVHGGPTFHGIQVLTKGHYLVSAWFSINAVNTTGALFTSWANNPGTSATYDSQGAILQIPTALGGVAVSLYAQFLVTAFGSDVNPWIAQVQNTTATNLSYRVQYIVTQLDTDSTPI